MRVPVRGPVQTGQTDFLPEEAVRGAEAEVGVGEEEVGAAEDEATGLGRGGGDVGGEEVEDGGDVGRADGG